MKLDARIDGLPEGDGIYMMINIVARRARDVNRSRVQVLYDDTQPDPTDVALNEYKNGLLSWEFHENLIGNGEDFRSVT